MSALSHPHCPSGIPQAIERSGEGWAVAAGRIRNKANEGLPCPPGWVLNKEGMPSADSDGSRPGFRDDLAHHSDLISLGVPR